MDADIKALENEVANINPPLLPSHLIGPAMPTTAPTQGTSSTTHPSAYTASRGPTHANPSSSIQYHPYNTTAAASSSSSTAAHTLIMNQQIAARSAIAQAQLQTARLQAQAAALTAARTRTLMSAAAQAQAARAAAIQRASNPSKSSIISCGPMSNPHKRNDYEESNHNYVGPSYTKNTVVNTKYNKYSNYKRYDYQYEKKNTATIPNSSLRNHCHDAMDMNNGKPPKKKKLKATHQYQLRTAANEKWVDPSMTDWPENDFRIFCGDLGNEVSDAMLTSAFSKYPSFAKAKVIRDKRTGKSKGYGFVSFLEPHDFIRAFKEMNGKYVGNRPIKLRRSKWKDRMKKVKNFKIRE